VRFSALTTPYSAARSGQKYFFLNIFFFFFVPGPFQGGHFLGGIIYFSALGLEPLPA
jgi:hypothetical protein